MTGSGQREIRVLHVGPGYGQRGGIATVLTDLQAQAGPLESRGIGTAIFPTRSFRSLANIVRFAAIDIPRFICAARRADIVQLHVASRGSLLRKAVMFVLAKAIRRRCVVHVHAGDFFDYYGRASSVYRAAVEIMVGRADARVVVSSAHRDEMTNCFGPAAEPTVIGNYAGEFEKRCAARTRSGEDGRYVFFAARLTESKGLEELFQAINSLKQRGVRVPLKVAGSGDTHRWRSLAQMLEIDDQVEFIGWIEGEAKVEAFARASIFCMPSYFESFGISTLEAMWAGRPVIGTTVGGFPDLVRDGETGYLVPPRNVPMLAERIGELWSDAARAECMGQAGREAAERQFRSTAIVDRYAALYARMYRVSAATNESR